MAEATRWRRLRFATSEAVRLRWASPCSSMRWLLTYMIETAFTGSLLSAAPDLFRGASIESPRAVARNTVVQRRIDIVMRP